MKNQLPILFDRELVRQRKANKHLNYSGILDLTAEVSLRLIERLKSIRRSFKHVLLIGFDGGVIQNYFKDLNIDIVYMDNVVSPFNSSFIPNIIGDEEAMPFAEASFDLIINVLTGHWINDFPGFLRQCQWSLKPDGLFLGSVVGEDSFLELRTSIAEADMTYLGGVGARFSPMLRTRDAGALLQRAGFALPVCDVDHLVIEYPTIIDILRDLRDSGCNTALINRSDAPPLFSRILMEADKVYKHSFPMAEGEVILRIDIVYMSGWCPDQSQQKPLARGSAQKHLSDEL